jgi:hypothetical protein
VVEDLRVCGSCVGHVVVVVVMVYCGADDETAMGGDRTSSCIVSS